MSASPQSSPFPLDAFMQTPDESKAISAAVTLVANRCMARYGFPPDVRPYRNVNPLDALARRYGTVRDVATAAKFGYHLPSPPRPEPASAPSVADRSAAEQAVLAGPEPGQAQLVVNGLAVPPGGCLGEGQRAVGREVVQEAPDALAYQLQGQVFSRVMADDRVRASHAAWSACMKASGYQESDPLDVTVPGSPDLTTGLPSADEVRKAVADAGCAQQARLWEVGYAVEVALQQEAVQRNLEQLRKGRQTIEGWLRRAAAVTSGAAPATASSAP